MPIRVEADNPLEAALLVDAAIRSADRLEWDYIVRGSNTKHTVTVGDSEGEA